MSKTNEIDAPQPRLPYEKPAVIAEEVFETLALSCVKSSPFIPGCKSGDVRS